MFRRFCASFGSRTSGTRGGSGSPGRGDKNGPNDENGEAAKDGAAPCDDEADGGGEGGVAGDAETFCETLAIVASADSPGRGDKNGPVEIGEAAEDGAAPGDDRADDGGEGGAAGDAETVCETSVGRGGSSVFFRTFLGFPRQAFRFTLSEATLGGQRRWKRVERTSVGLLLDPRNLHVLEDPNENVSSCLHLHFENSVSS